MKIFITYFYNIRFVKPHMIPLSTAVWDPKWFHNFQGHDIIFKDKNNVLNGIRYPDLSPTNIAPCCPCENKDPTTCQFIKDYAEYLDTLDFDKVYSDLTFIGNKGKEILKFDEEPEICLMVYEKPDNPCSERKSLIEYFNKHGIPITEWNK